jgi:hypothetical protein
MYKKHKCNKVVFMGDIVDNHAISYHESDANGLSPGDELKLARYEVKKWYKAFPKASICSGNHDELPYRKAQTMGIPSDMIKSPNDIWEIKAKWDWQDSFIFDGVRYFHGTGLSGMNAALKAATGHRRSCVIGHVHSFAGIQFTASEKDCLWGMNVGCGIDVKHPAFNYGKKFLSRPIISCGIILEGNLPMIERMFL